VIHQGAVILVPKRIFCIFIAQDHNSLRDKGLQQQNIFVIFLTMYHLWGSPVVAHLLLCTMCNFQLRNIMTASLLLPAVHTFSRAAFCQTDINFWLCVTW